MRTSITVAMWSHHYVFDRETEDALLKAFAETQTRMYHPHEDERWQIVIMCPSPPTKHELYRRGWKPPLYVPMFRSFPLCTTRLRLSIETPCEFLVEYVQHLPLEFLELDGFDLDFDSWARFLSNHPTLTEVAFYKCHGNVAPMTSIFSNRRISYFALLRCDGMDEEEFERALGENTTMVRFAVTSERVWKDKRVRCI